MNVQKEAQAVATLIAKADKLETESDQKAIAASDARWEAAQRSYEITQSGACSQKKFAEMVGVSSSTIQRMVKAWGWVLDQRTHGGSRWTQPTWASAVEILRNPGIEERAIKAGKSPATLGRYERNALLATRDPEGAKQVVKDSKSRQSLKRAIREVEEEEDAAEAEAIRQRALADAKKRPAIDVPAPSSKFGTNAQLEAGALIGKATRAITMFIRLVHDRGPVPETAREALLEELTDHQERVAWAISALNNGITDWDEALAQLAEG